MRLIGKFEDRRAALTFSNYLFFQAIENEIDPSREEEPADRDVESTVWVVDEDQFETALNWYNLFQSDPDNPLFKRSAPPAFEIGQEEEDTPPEAKTKTVKKEQFFFTYLILLVCSMLFLASGVGTPHLQKIPKNVPLTPVLMPNVEKTLLYDYPLAWEYIDKLVENYGVKSLEEPQDLPNEGKLLLYQFYNTPYWQGYYDEILGFFAPKDKIDPQTVNAPLFEKIRQGEVWRLFTPCLLHFDLFHIFFNMIWLIVLGRQMETKLGGGRYLLFIVVTAIFSNTAQYLMSGPSFIGFSGVVLAMIGFITMRQRIAIWEGYQLTRSTLLFVALFIGSILGLQLISFILEIAGVAGFSPPIANTAHIAGALSGAALGSMSYFAWKR